MALNSSANVQHAWACSISLQKRDMGEPYRPYPAFKEKQNRTLCKKIQYKKTGVMILWVNIF